MISPVITWSSKGKAARERAPFRIPRRCAHAANCPKNCSPVGTEEVVTLELAVFSYTRGAVLKESYLSQTFLDSNTCHC